MDLAVGLAGRARYGGRLSWGEYSPASRTFKLWNESQTSPNRVLAYDGPVDVNVAEPYEYGFTAAGDLVSMTAVGDSDGSIRFLAGRFDFFVSNEPVPVLFASNEPVPVLEHWIQGSWSSMIGDTVDCGEQQQQSGTDVGNLPNPVAFFGATVSGTSLYVFGGGNGCGDRYCSNGLWHEQYSYTYVRSNASGSTSESTFVRLDYLHSWDQGRDWAFDLYAKPENMTNRYGHAMASMGDHVFLFGGTHGNLDATHLCSQFDFSLPHTDNRNISVAIPDRSGRMYTCLDWSEKLTLLPDDLFSFWSFFGGDAWSAGGSSASVEPCCWGLKHGSKPLLRLVTLLHLFRRAPLLPLLLLGHASEGVLDCIGFHSFG